MKRRQNGLPRECMSGCIRMMWELYRKSVRAL
ncbi:MAG: hypothetical protein J6B53_16690 [Clostridia bacterium]|nr:hypothetical protein [Clostridia bacterium]